MPEGFLALKATTAQIWSHPTWDLILLFALIAGGFFYGISFGKARIAATIIYTYVALVITLAVPEQWFSKITDMAGGVLVKAGVFIIIFFALAFFLGARRKNRGFVPAGSWWQVFILSFLQVGLFIHIQLGFLPQMTIDTLAPLTKSVFANPNYHIWWMVLPISVLIFLKRIDERKSD